VDVVEDLSLLSSANLEAYDAVVMHFKNYDPNVPGRKGFDNLARYVQQGGGLVLVHFACGAFQEFKDDFTQLAGRAWNPELRGHDPFGEFTVNITDQTHPITKGLQDFAITDELYTCLDGDVPIKVLASATSKVDKKVYPMAFVLKHGKGRVFHSVLGHDVNALSNQGAAELYRRGTAWTVGIKP
jgi:type 1 glutamine amidotransferase